MIQLPSSSRFFFFPYIPMMYIAVPIWATRTTMRCRLFLGQDVKGSVADCWRRDFTFCFFILCFWRIHITYIYIPFFHPFIYIYKVYTYLYAALYGVYMSQHLAGRVVGSPTSSKLSCWCSTTTVIWNQQQPKGLDIVILYSKYVVGFQNGNQVGCWACPYNIRSLSIVMTLNDAPTN